MQLSDFNFDLPDELIARYPLDTRSASRLLHLDAQGQHHDFQFTDILDLLDAGDLLVLNDTKVMKARLKGKRASGGAVEVLEGLRRIPPHGRRNHQLGQRRDVRNRGACGASRNHRVQTRRMGEDDLQCATRLSGRRKRQPKRPICRGRAGCLAGGALGQHL